ncbi:aldehyde dehydrogenase family protein [Streptomyces sp. ME02-8801-2C]|uniref:aldehyde dehydrogenase family protein n=1 Tax=Streptomyces sp. ME02-8801-2C TaxID=3028680 RepID=UPI0029B83044|nr:aldehyde dehydrogenase family protein [Streptomyces sp. ME02-8801-2C]MDX3452015.1 aldehyde dehydrogenase family protein [Streptomyces sp. ME02-8801-2C]
MGAQRPHIEPGGLFIAGAWREAEAGGRRDVVDPSTGQVVTTVAEADEADLDAAVAAAREAFDQGPWSGTPARERARVLNRVAGLIRERADEIAAVESLDVGKPVTLSRAVDVETAAETYEYYSALAQSLDGSTRQIPLPAHAYTRRDPLGVCGLVTPFNFPLILSSSKLAPALAAGNTVVHKPAEDTPLSALLMADILTAAGVPAGVVNVVTGGGALGGALVRHHSVDKIAFTGSTRVGRVVAGTAAEQLKPVTMELGGNAAQIVFEDADVEKAVGAVIKGFVYNTGQFCMGAPRLLVHRSLHDTVVGILMQAVPGVPVGDPFDPATVVGPMAGERHLENVERYVELARKDGGQVVVGGERRELGGGYYYEPTVVTGLDNDARTVQEEVFGPVLTVQAFDTEDEAVALANSTAYGLAGGLHTSDLARAHRVAARLQAGIVWVNDWAMLDPSMPFGGVKQSGYGRESGPEALQEYTKTKSVVISLA